MFFLKEKSCQSRSQLYNFKKRKKKKNGCMKGVITLMASEKALF